MEELVKGVLQYYKEKDDKSERSLKYYHLFEEEPLESEFELYSNNRLLLVKSKLDKMDMSVILSIFNNIYDGNYYIFEDFDYLRECFNDLNKENEDDSEEESDDDDDSEDDLEEIETDDEDIQTQMNEDFELMKTYDLKYVELWVQYLNLIEIYDLKSYKKVPKPLLKNKQQKIYEIEDLINMVGG
jgi:hypothetical protein